jgi:hypothetical protein
LQIWFMDSSGEIVERQITTMEQSFPYDPWLKAIGLLGGSGWELVTVTIRSDPERHQSLLLDDQSAYFKRPVITGRPIDDVELNFQLSQVVLPLDR